ncbi:MAG TPA: tyrosine-protein phosphatase [Steroidobacteraceae bacterium]
MIGFMRPFGSAIRIHGNAAQAGWGVCRSMPFVLTLLPVFWAACCVSGCVYFSRHTPRGACSNDLGSTVRNFCVVSSEVLWRGERPTKSDAQWLLNHQVGSIVSVQLDDRRAFQGAAPAQAYVDSVPYYEISGFSPLQMLNPSRLDEHVAVFLAIVKQARKPVFVHCRAGIDRTGVLAATYRVVIEGVSREKAIAEMGRFHSPWQRIDARYIRSLSPQRQAAILRKVDEWESRLRPSARIDCAQGRCTFLRSDTKVDRQLAGQLVPPDKP